MRPTHKLGRSHPNHFLHLRQHVSRLHADASSTPFFASLVIAGVNSSSRASPPTPRCKTCHMRCVISCSRSNPAPRLSSSISHRRVRCSRQQRRLLHRLLRLHRLHRCSRQQRSRGGGDAFLTRATRAHHYPLISARGEPAEPAVATVGFRCARCSVATSSCVSSIRRSSPLRPTAFCPRRPRLSRAAPSFSSPRRAVALAVAVCNGL